MTQAEIERSTDQPRAATERNLSIDAHFQRLAEAHVPKYRFGVAGPRDFKTWQRELLPQVRALLGEAPETVNLNPELIVEWQEHGLIKEKVVFDVEPGLSVHAYVFRPADAKGPLPGILCCHGHGRAGKEAVMGTALDAAGQQETAALNYAYGLEMAKAGFATIAIDWRGFGDRDDRRKPHHHDVIGNRDICNVHYLRETILGRTVLGANVHDGKRALDYFCQQDFVDGERIGVMGLSFGGTMTTWMALCDERIKAADIICYADRFADFGMRDVNFCGSQIVPGLYALCDLPDLHGLIAPRPLLVEVGVHDQCFRVQSAMSCYRETEKIYEAAGVRNRLELDLFPGSHAWGANKSVAFFQTALG
ncbi:MAG: alpha/beta hydrolase family protein [Phycisphaeraceae bacterium]